MLFPEKDSIICDICSSILIWCSSSTTMLVNNSLVSVSWDKSTHFKRMALDSFSSEIDSSSPLLVRRALAVAPSIFAIMEEIISMCLMPSESRV